MPEEVFNNGYIVLYKDKTGYYNDWCGPEDEEGLRKVYEALKDLFEIVIKEKENNGRKN